MIDQEKIIETLIAIRKYFGYGQPSQTDTFKRYQQALSDAITLLIDQKDEIRKLKMFDEDRII